MTTLIIGASHKPQRFAFKALQALQAQGHSPLLFSPRGGEIASLPVYSCLKEINGQLVDTITLYINPKRLPSLLEDIIALSPRRVIFNPGTESIEATRRFMQAGIEPVEDCTLIMLRESYY